MGIRVFHIERIRSSEPEFEYKAMVIDDHRIFGGHFPQSPVVPGVCTMGMVKDCIEHALSRRVRYRYIKECKFLGAIIPSEHKILTVHLSVTPGADDDLAVAAEVSHAGVKMMKIKATLI